LSEPNSFIDVVISMAVVYLQLIAFATTTTSTSSSTSTTTSTRYYPFTKSEHGA